MTTEILLRYLHFISILFIAGTLAAEFVLLKPQLTRREIGRIALIDGVYGLAAVVLVAAGLTLWLGGYTKPSLYYSQNWIFLTKMGFLTVIGLLSIHPTVFFIRKRNGDPAESVDIPVTVTWCLRLELILLAVIPFLAGLMSRGVGFMA